MVNKYDDPVNRDKAEKRAKKMWKLIDKSEKHFSAIMKAVDPVFDEGAFINACNGAGLDGAETAWLKTYLLQCNQAVYSTVPEAAATGW